MLRPSGVQRTARKILGLGTSKILGAASPSIGMTAICHWPLASSRRLHAIHLPSGATAGREVDAFVSSIGSPPSAGTFIKWLVTYTSHLPSGVYCGDHLLLP